MTTRLTELAVSTTGNIIGGNVIANVIQTNNFQYANGQPFTGGSGNATLPLANGTSNFNIATANGNATVTSAGNTWAFDNTGNLVLPQGGIVYETNIPDGGLSGSTVALKPSGGSNADQQLLVYPTTTDANHLHLTSGNLYNTELFLGDDNLYVKLANTGNVVVNSNDGVGNTAQWTFSTDGNLNIPSDGSIVNNSSNIRLISHGNIWSFNGIYNSLTIPAGGAIRTATSSNGSIMLHPDGVGTVIIQGGASAGPLLLLQSDTANAQNRIEIDTFGSSNNLGGTLTGRFSRGNLIAPAAVQAGDQLMSVRGKGYDGTAFSTPVGSISVNAFDNWTTGNVPSQLRFYTTGYDDGSSPILNMTISPTGNVDILNGNLVVSGGGGYLQGNTVTGNDALYAGSANFVPLGSNVVAQFGANSNGYSQINFQNISDGGLASADYILTANNGDDSTYFVDLGITSNNHSDSAFFGDTTTANDAYLYVVGADATGPGGGADGNLILGSTNGNIKMFVGNTAQANVIQTITTSGVIVAGDIIPAANTVYSLGNSTNYWSNLWVANNTIYIGGVALGMTAGNVLTVDGNAVLTNGSNTAVSTTGNITADYFFGDGSQLAGISANTGNVTFSGETVIGTGTSNTQSGLYLAPDPVSLTNDLYLRVRGNILDEPTHIHFDTGNNQYYNLIIGDDNKYIQLANTGNIVINTNNYAGNTAQWNFSTDGTLTLPAGSSRITSYGQITIETDNNASGMYLNADGVNLLYANANVTLRANSTGTNKDWNFGNTGVLTLPLGGVVSEGASPTGLGNTIALTPAGGSDADQQLLMYPTGNVMEGNHLHLTTGNLYNTELYLGNDNLYVKLANTGNVVINSYDGVGNAGQWTFGTDSNLTTPGGMIINGNINTLGSQTALLQPTDDLPLSFIASGANGTVTSYWAEDVANLMSSNIAAVYTPLQNTQTVRIVTGTNGGNIAIYDFDKDGVFSTAQVSATGNITANYFSGNGSLLTGISASLPVANGTSNFDIATANGNVTITANAETYTFGTNSTLTLPGGSQLRPVGANLDLVAGTGAYVNLITSDESSSVGVDNGGGYVTTAGGTWDFDTTGNLTAPGNVSAVGNIASGNLTVGSGTITGGNVNGAVFNGNVAFGTGTVGGSGNITGGNLITTGSGGDITMTGGNITGAGNISATGNITGNYFIGNGSQLTGITASVPSQTILPTIQTITVSDTSGVGNAGGGGSAFANVTVANTIPVTEYGVIITSGTSSQKYATGALGSIPGTVKLTFTTGLNSTPFTVFAYVTSNAGTYYSNATTGTSGICLLAGTQIALSDGTRKAIEHITYTDKMLSWDFDRGCYAETTALWIKRGETGSQYNLLTFSDGTTLRTFDQHRIFNKQAGEFTYPMTDATPIGTVTVNEHGQEIILTNKQVIVDTIEYYNVITDHHMNLFSDTVLTSCRFNNIYPITDMKFVKDGRTLRTRAEFENIPDRFFYGLRLAEQTTDIETVEWYVNRLLSTEVSTESELTV